MPDTQSGNRRVVGYCRNINDAKLRELARAARHQMDPATGVYRLDSGLAEIDRLRADQPDGWLLLADIRRQIPFETEDRQLTVQYFPSRGGGCEMFISSVPFCGERKKQSEQRGGALTVRAGRQSPAVFRRDGAYRFETLDCLLRACRRLRDAGFAGESTAYRDDSGRYYILLVTVSPSPFSVPDEFSFLSEYGETENPARLRIWFREHGSLICAAGAVATLGALA